MPRSLLSLLLLAGSACAGAPHPVSSVTSSVPQAVANDVLATERRFSAAAATQPFVSVMNAMLTTSALMPAPRGEILSGRGAIVAALAATADSTAHARWTPIQVGLSEDGTHAFTVGFLITTRRDGSRAQFKYLTYWIRGNDGWRAAAWRRRPMESIAIDSTMLPALLPDRLIAPTANAATLDGNRIGLREAEGEFSALANRIGVGAAFAQRGTPASLNVGPPTVGHFIRGADAIAQSVAGGQPLDAPSSIVWGADAALVAPSNDLGITFGVIRSKATPTAGGASFFTIWRKSNGSWRYIAE